MTFTPFESGIIRQTIYTRTSTTLTTTTIMPLDNTIPQSTEGGEFFTQAITPKSLDNPLFIRVGFLCSTNTAARTINVALFRDTGADALVAVAHAQSAISTMVNINFEFQDNVSEETGPTFTYKVRAGLEAAGTLRMNGVSGQLFGGVAASYISIFEIQS